MATGQSPSVVMSASMNMAITICGFTLSAVFIMVICCRLLCSRYRNGEAGGVRSYAIERSLHGLEARTVMSFPTVKYSDNIFVSNEDNVCSICLSDYNEKEVLRILPLCGHAFHVLCIDVWLRRHSTCPICRISMQISETKSSLINHSAKIRFTPGVLPDSMFEQLIAVESVEGGLEHKEGYKQSANHNKDSRDLEMAEASSSQRYEGDNCIDIEHLVSSKAPLPREHIRVIREANLTSEGSRKHLLLKTCNVDGEEGHSSSYDVEAERELDFVPDRSLVPSDGKV